MKKVGRVVMSGDGRTLNVLGHAATLKLGCADSKGDYYTFELVSPPGAGVPPHVHIREDEIMYMVQGECEIRLGRETWTATAGATVHLPRGVPHRFQNVGPSPAKTLWTIVPGTSFEPFFDELAALPSGPPDPGRIAAIFGRYGMELIPQQPT
ncbi:MAG TPA: cupin domain-containing protein [Hyphomicrobiaceae bacterium]|jgi:quercetin dioxygenase-like cupin family protein